MQKIIAIIDDEPEMEDIYQIIFEDLIDRESVAIKFFEDALTFLHWYRSHRPDYLLSDINLPGLDGLELAQEIRRIEKQALTPGMQISFVSGYHPESYSTFMDEFRISRFIPKPVAVRDTLGLILQDLGLVSP